MYVVRTGPGEGIVACCVLSLVALNESFVRDHGVLCLVALDVDSHKSHSSIWRAAEPFWFFVGHDGALCVPLHGIFDLVHTP